MVFDHVLAPTEISGLLAGADSHGAAGDWDGLCGP